MTDWQGTLWDRILPVVAEVNALLAQMNGVITLNDAKRRKRRDYLRPRGWHGVILICYACLLLVMRK